VTTPSTYDTLAAEILPGVGGPGNVASVTHCATRLRLVLQDRDRADKAAVEAARGVITVVEAGGQFQVVIGKRVNNVYEALTASGEVATGGEVGGGVLAKAIDLVTSIFTPFLWVLAGTGLLRRCWLWGSNWRPTLQRPRPPRSCSRRPTRCSSSCPCCSPSPRRRSSRPTCSPRWRSPVR
jgi:phosphotransferase system IIB component